MPKTANRIINTEAEVREKALAAIERAAMPVIKTIGPKGENVVYPDMHGNMIVTNDGVTIIKNIYFKDQIDNTVVQILKEGALRTNQQAGDATSTTTLFSYKLIKRAYELKKKGFSQRAIRDILSNVAEKLLKGLSSQKREVKSKDVEFEIAKISANNDAEIAKLTCDTIETTGVDGMVFIELSQNEDTFIEKQTGFRIPNGMLYQNLYNDHARPVAAYKNIKVIVFDKQLYYAEECEHILRVAQDLGYNELVIVAKNFVGDAPNTFIANHAQGVIKLVLAKCDSDIQMEDLAVYLGGTVVSEAAGRRVDSIGMMDFMDAESVYADPQKVLIKSAEENSKLKKRIAAIKTELKEKENDKELKDRLASLTNGIVTIKVGGRTVTEAKEKAFRFEDAISAVRAAKVNGFLVGGGLSMYNAYNPKDYTTKEENETARMLSRASVETLAENSMYELEYDKLTKDIGLNALTGKYENLYKAGVVEPYKAVEMAVKNAVSVAELITSIGTYITNDYDESDSEGSGKED